MNDRSTPSGDPLNTFGASAARPDANPTTAEKPKKAHEVNTIVIKKYANRRLYNTATSTYVTLEDLAAMVKAGTEFTVYDAKSGEDITRSVLTQIIFEEESKGVNLLPIKFLRQLIGYYGNQMQAFVPGYLEFSLDSLGKDQDKLREQMAGAFSPEALKQMGSLAGIEDMTKRNMTLFADAMKMFNPFAAPPFSGMGPFSAMGMTEAAQPPDTPPQEPRPAAAPSSSNQDELQALKQELASMQQKVDKLVNR